MLIYLIGCMVTLVAGDDPVDIAVGVRPFQVSLRLHDVVYDSNYHFCSGAILNTKWVVTAARCLDNKRAHRIRVVAGTVTIDSEGSWHEVEQKIMNGNYKSYDVANDVGLLKIKDEFEFNDKISAINLPKEGTPPESVCSVAGWGYFSSEGKFSSRLQAVNVTTITTEECRKSDLNEYQNNINPITDRQICAYKQDGRGICSTDQGAPLTKDNELVGIASFDVDCSPNIPNVYLRVYDYKGWITGHMN